MTKKDTTPEQLQNPTGNSWKHARSIFVLHMYDYSISWLGTDISIKSDGVKKFADAKRVSGSLKSKERRTQ